MNRAISTASKSLALTSLVLIGAAFALGGSRFGIGAIVGCALIGSSWLLTVFACRRALDEGEGDTRSRGFTIATVALAKIALIVSVIHVSIRFFHLEPMSLALGVIALVVALLVVSRRLTALADVDDAARPNSGEALDAAR